MQIGIIIQARFGSSRLPGKVLRTINGKPLLEYLLDRLRHYGRLKTIIVATSTEAIDTPIADYAAAQGVVCHRGSLNNVAKRLLNAAEEHALDVFVRISADSPLLDTTIVNGCLERFLGTDCDLVTNIHPRTFPCGQSVEVIRRDSLARAHLEMSEPEDFEHVTRLFYRQANRYRIENIESDTEFPSMHLAVDTPEDWQTCTAILRAMQRPHWDYGLEEVVQLYNSVVQVACEDR